MSTDAKRYYAVLGVEPQASAEAIRVAFRQRAKELHPDAQSGNATAFILLKRAYDTLCNPIDRAAYDRLCASERPVDPSQVRTPPHNPARQPMPPQPMPRHKPMRRSGVGIGRYVIAFIVMAAISLGGIQAMISLTAAPPSVKTRAVGGNVASQPEAAPAASTQAAEPSQPPGSSKSGFWEAEPAPARRGK